MNSLVRRRNPGPVGQVRDKWLGLSNINEVFRQRKALPLSKRPEAFSAVCFYEGYYKSELGR